ncbi:hypothetical protein [Draconibacterium mangrovi]|uniref:hypothetical protein n=1 Tax=Draconibacterium mangrovi TaxID=2697469 RepID=UPI0013D52BA6|nr:hypothetical protein [Draconibacterium mangrovi]
MKDWDDFLKKLIAKLNSFRNDGLGNYLYYPEEKLTEVKDDINELFHNSAEDDYLWPYCSFTVFKNNLKIEFEKFKAKYPNEDPEPKDFADEIIGYVQKTSCHSVTPNSKPFSPHLVSDKPILKYLLGGHDLKRITGSRTYENIEFAQKKKQRYLQEIQQTNKFAKISTKPNKTDISVDLINPHLSALRDVQPPIINKEGQYNLGERSKGAITAWIEVLKLRGHLPQKDNSRELVSILNELIPGLNMGIDGKTLRNIETSAYKKYHTKLLSLIS